MGLFSKKVEPPFTGHCGLLPICGFFSHYDSVADALRDSGPLERELDGWRFFEGLPPAGFETPDFDDSAFERRELPCVYESDGPLGCCRTEFTLSPHDGFEYALRFDSLLPAAEIYVNGRLAATADEGYAPLELPLEPLAGDGKNTLALRFLPGTLLDWKQGPNLRAGLFGRVYIVERPRSRINDLSIRVETLNGGTVLNIDASVLADDQRLLDEGGAVGFTLFSGETPVASGSAALGPFERRDWQYCRLGAALPETGLWSPESPELMRLVVGLARLDGSELDLVGLDLGLRELSIAPYNKKNGRGPRLLLNRRPIRLRGASYSARPGDLLERDLRSFKKAGFNAVRLLTPPERRVFSLCDRLGLMVFCEISLRLPPFKRRLAPGEANPVRLALARVGSVAAAYRTSSSLCGWSVGPYSDYGVPLYCELLRQLDDCRIVVCEGDYTFSRSDFFCASDCSPAELERIVEGRPVHMPNPYGWPLKLDVFKTGEYRRQPFALWDYEPLDPNFPLGVRIEAEQRGDRAVGGFCRAINADSTAELEALARAFAAGYGQSEENND